MFWPRRAETDTPYLDEDANAGRARCPNAPRGTAGVQHGKDTRPTNVLARRAETDTPYLDDDTNAGRARCPNAPRGTTNAKNRSDRPKPAVHPLRAGQTR